MHIKIKVSSLEPKVSVFWINYNSIHVIDIIKKSLSALLRLEYPNYELIIVDNGSTDGSLRVIEKHIKSYKKKNENPSRTHVLKLNKNLGFAGGANFAYRAKDPTSEYVAIVNNDAIPRKDYLKKLVSFMESHENVGAVQGLILRLGSDGKIDSAGMFIDEFVKVHAPFIGKPAGIFRKPFHVSFVEGTMPLYRVDAIVHSLKSDNIMYITAGFLYFLEDAFLSLMMWNHGYECVVLPLITGEHYRKATLKKFAEQVGLQYYSLRNRIALLEMTNSRKKQLVFLNVLRRLFISRASYHVRKNMLRALVDGIYLGKILREKYGVLNLGKVPVLRCSTKVRL